MNCKSVLVLMVAALAACQAPPGERADLVLQNANVVTMDRNAPKAEAIAVAGDRILAVGTEAAIRRYIGSETEVIDLEGTTVIPGLIDSHVPSGESRLTMPEGV